MKGGASSESLLHTQFTWTTRFAVSTVLEDQESSDDRRGPGGVWWVRREWSHRVTSWGLLLWRLLFRGRVVLRSRVSILLRLGGCPSVSIVYFWVLRVNVTLKTVSTFTNHNHTRCVINPGVVEGSDSQSVINRCSTPVCRSSRVLREPRVPPRGRTREERIEEGPTSTTVSDRRS